ncbi:hypothetical protein AB0368_06735 [Actinoplanes sp. NPDC051475]|uniref:hypothetical protein n=1 Tax=Actinoplanes sp. NPDC051475 TaxID=3157225 RepID=UPI00344F0BF9
MPALPPGSRLLTADEAVEALITGDHGEAAPGTLELDAALVELLRSGQIVAARMPDQRIAFSPVPAADDQSPPA